MWSLDARDPAVLGPLSLSEKFRETIVQQSPVAAEVTPEPLFTADELENSFPMDHARRFRCEGGHDLVRFVREGMDSRGPTRKRSRRAAAEKRHNASIEALLANIVAAHLNSVDPERFVAVSFKRTDYDRTELSRDALGACRDYLSEVGLIDCAGGFRKREVHDDKQYGRLTRIRASALLRDHVESRGIGKRSLTIPVSQLVRIKKPITGLPPMPPEIAASQAVIEAVNRRLAATTIGVSSQALAALKASLIDDEGEDELERDRKRRYAGDLTATSIYRAFKGDWSNGGRFYGGWWMSFPKDLRSHITINGEPVVELDYATLHPRLLYRRAGLDLDLDPYQVPSWHSPAMRQLGKRTFNRLLNRSTPDQAKRLDLRAGKGDLAALPKGLKFASYRDELIQHLDGIEHWFGTGEGVRLQYEDSLLALSVMEAMEAEGVPTLPIHDSFIVPAINEEQLYLAMLEAFALRYSDIPPIHRPASLAARHSGAPRGP